jgi:alpha-tubulin suppressor-like RCC1 family protein
VQVSGLGAIGDISGGDSHSLAVSADGVVWGWGYNYYGQVGDGTKTSRSLPVQLSDPGFN